jgi:DNA-directed RNA polymerase subunit M/transcription elongation factor TFIIS
VIEQKLPIFRLKQPCVKCGNSDNLATHIVHNERAFFYLPLEKRALGKGEPEWMFRQCKVCQYSWAEEPLDRAPTLERFVPTMRTC